jgi:hypothetical protein
MPSGCFTQGFGETISGMGFDPDGGVRKLRDLACEVIGLGVLIENRSVPSGLRRPV